MPVDRRIAVIGGGMAGCVLAGELARVPGFRVDLYEVGDRLGGLHHSPVLDGRAFDIGAFFFEPTHQVFRTFPGLIDRFVEFPVKVVSVSDGGRMDRYPLSLGGYLRHHGYGRLLLGLADLGVSKVRFARKHTLVDYIRYYLGGTIYEDSGLRHYIERMFGLPAEEIDLAFAARRMQNLERFGSVRRVVARAARAPLGWANIPYFSPTTLARPRAGFVEAYGAIEAQLVARGVAVHKGARITAIENLGDGFRIRLADAAPVYDRVASTAPMATTARLCGLSAEFRFETVTLLSLMYRYDGPSGHDAAVAYNFSRGGPWKRITDFSYIYGEQEGAFAAELPLPNVRPADVDVDALRRDFEAHLAEVGLYRGGVRLVGHVITPSAYPIYRAQSLDLLDADKRRLADWGLILAGRQGEFEYLSSSQVATNVARLAERIVADLGRAAG